MKTKVTLEPFVLYTCLRIVLGIITMMVMVPASRAGLTGPYTNDFYTLHLWHLQDTNGTVPYDATNGVFEFDYATNAQSVQIVMSNTPGPNAFAGPANTQYSLAGQPGPGASIIGTNYGYALSIMTTQSSCFFCPWFTNSSTGYDEYPAYPAYTNISNFVNTNTGAFTMEALVKPQFNPFSPPSGYSYANIICGDGPNNNPALLFMRSFIFRMNLGGSAALNFENLSLVAPGTNSNMSVGLPTSGPDAVVQGQWYHVAVAYTGSAPTNGDPPHMLTFYWTLFNPARTNADVLTNFPWAFCETNLVTGQDFTYPYPSNSIVGTPMLLIGGDGRGYLNNVADAQGWIGNIAEVRISDCYRHPNEFMFNSSPVFLPPTITGLSTNNLVGYGQTLTLSTLVSGTTPIAFQWYQNGQPVDGQTNSTLVVSNITYAANGNYQLFVTNAYGHTNSVVAAVMVGATFDGLFNTGCGPDNNPLDQTAPGSVDLHWQLPGDPDTTALIPDAIVWGDKSPLQPYSVVPPNGASVWIGPHENSGGVGGTYTYQTTFQVDETVVSTNTVLSGSVGACGAPAGTTLQMFLNGVETDVPLSVNPSENIFPFSITNGLQPGSNTLVCTVNQSGSFGSGFNLDVLSDTGAPLTNAPAITNQPIGVTNLYGSSVSFSAVALGAPPLTYYWLSNSVAITPPVWVFTAVPYLSFVATNFSTSELVGTNYFANYQIVFSNSVGSVTSEVATLDVQISPLTIASAGVPIWEPTDDETNIVIYFSGAVDPFTATATTNYLLNGVAISSATLGSAPGEVILTTTTALTPSTSYTLTVQNVESSFGFPMSPLSQQVAVGTYPATALWLKASTGIVSDGSGGVGQWNDLSGNGNNFMSAYGPDYDPVLATNAYGYPVVRFNGSNDDTLYANNTTSLQITSNMTIFAVVNFVTLAGGTNGEIISETADNDLPAPYDYYANSSSVLLLRGTGGGTPGSTASYKDPSAGVPHILDVVMQGTQVTHRLDGNTNGTGAISTVISDAGQPIQIGTRADGANHLTGDVNELILIGQALSSSDVASMENYLATEYNMPTGTNSYPVITQQPVASTTVNQGGALIVSAAASGTPAVAYQWYDVNSIAQAGQTNATLVISNDLANDSYYLVATNVYGSATSSVVVVSLVTGLNVSLGPPAITLYAGQTVTLDAVATGNAPFYYQWYQNGSPIANATNAGYTVIAGSSTTDYACTVSNNYNGYSSTNVGPVALSSIAAPTTLYQLTVLSNNPVAYWRLNEGPDNGLGNDGIVACDYADGHNGVYTNVELGLPGFGSQDSTDTAALFGIFNASPSNSCVEEINDGLSPINFAEPTGSNGEFSVEAWVCSSNAQILGAGIVAKGYGSGGEQFDLDVYNGFRFFARDASGDVHGPGLSTVPTIGQWYYVVGVFDGANGIVHLYTNGVDAIDTTGIATGLGILTATTTNALLPQAALVSIGARASSQAVTNYDFQFQGKIQDVALYNYALSAAQVAAHYQASGLAVPPVNTNPTNIVFSVTNNLLYLSWPANHIGWQLQAQTNSVKVGLSTNWVNVSGSLDTNQVIIPLNLTNGSVFYRLMYQQ